MTEISLRESEFTGKANSIEDSKVTFVITEKLKHTRAGTHQKPLEF